jgi:hypothetical protein
VIPAEIGILQIEIGPYEKAGNPLFETSFELEFSVVLLDGFSFIPIEKPEFIQSSISVEDEKDRPEFDIPPDVIGFLLDLRKVEFVLFICQTEGRK